MIKKLKRNSAKIIVKLGKIFLLFDKVFKTRIYEKIFRWYLKSIGVILNGLLYVSTDLIVDTSGEISIGHGVTISIGVVILTHDYSIHQAYRYKGKTPVGVIVKPVSIGNNTFIGARSIILPGAQIGNNVIIGAGTVVRGKIPDNVVVSGNPCKIVESMDEHYEIQEKYNKKYYRLRV